ncbi:MAG: hypothetical protein KGO48_13860 [Alphaproteobacteria bacterium]|nr:hypothetical protein [Alphaproteobacteria bacterium]
MSDVDRLAHKWVKCLLRSEMIKHGVSYADLAKRLADIGVIRPKAALRSRVTRGTCSGAFLFLCLTVIGTENVNVDLYDFISGALSRDQQEGHIGRRIRSGPKYKRRTLPIGTEHDELASEPAPEITPQKLTWDGPVRFP